MSKNPFNNGNSLDEIFNLTSPNPSHDESALQSMVDDMRNQLPALTNQDEPDSILYKNIERANKLLDKLESSILSQETPNARLIEVCGQLINAITTATTSIAGNSFAAQKHEYNMKMIEVKEQEVEVKRIVATNKVDSANKGGGGDNSSNEKKVLVMDRESLLRMIEDEKKDVHVETYKPLHRND